jgi:hypothetical protein
VVFPSYIDNIESGHIGLITHARLYAVQPELISIQRLQHVVGQFWFKIPGNFGLYYVDTKVESRAHDLVPSERTCLLNQLLMIQIVMMCLWVFFWNRSPLEFLYIILLSSTNIFRMQKWTLDTRHFLMSGKQIQVSSVFLWKAAPLVPSQPVIIHYFLFQNL